MEIIMVQTDLVKYYQLQTEFIDCQYMGSSQNLLISKKFNISMISANVDFQYIYRINV